jgi:transcriptional regulator with XRE-family HTH domain
MRIKPQLRQEREQRGWSQEKVAEELGVDRVTVSRWERGISLPYPYYREKLSILFSKDVQELGILDQNEEEGHSRQLSASSLPGSQSGFLYDPAIPSLLANANRLIGRSHLLEELKQCILSRERYSITTLQGLPGVGKTTLAVALTAHSEVRTSFTDGIFWAGLGPNPNIFELLNHWDALLGFKGTTDSMLRDLPARTEALHKVIGQRRMLLVIDDVWRIEDAQSLLVGGPNCVHLLTTRFPHIAAQLSEGDAVAVPELTENDGVKLLARFAPDIVKNEQKRRIH